MSRSQVLAKKFAKKIIKKIINNQPINLEATHREVGYTKKSAHTQTALKTQAAKEIFQENKEILKPYTEKLGALGHKLLDHLGIDKMENATGRDIMYMFDITHKNKLLAEGKATEHIGIHAVVEIKDKTSAEEYLKKYLQPNV